MKKVILLFVTLLLCSCAGTGPDPVTPAATGVAMDEVLDKAFDNIHSLLGRTDVVITNQTRDILRQIEAKIERIRREVGLDINDVVDNFSNEIQLEVSKIETSIKLLKSELKDDVLDVSTDVNLQLRKTLYGVPFSKTAVYSLSDIDGTYIPYLNNNKHKVIARGVHIGFNDSEIVSNSTLTLHTIPEPTILKGLPVSESTVEYTLPDNLLAQYRDRNSPKILDAELNFEIKEKKWNTWLTGKEKIVYGKELIKLFFEPDLVGQVKVDVASPTARWIRNSSYSVEKVCPASNAYTSTTPSDMNTDSRLDQYTCEYPLGGTVHNPPKVGDKRLYYYKYKGCAGDCSRWWSVVSTSINPNKQIGHASFHNRSGPKTVTFLAKWERYELAPDTDGNNTRESQYTYSVYRSEDFKLTLPLEFTLLRMRAILNNGKRVNVSMTRDFNDNVYPDAGSDNGLKYEGKNIHSSGIDYFFTPF